MIPSAAAMLGNRQRGNEKSPQPAAESGVWADLAGFNPTGCPDHSPRMRRYKTLRAHEENKAAFVRRNNGRPALS
eukprot:superscaffoldBa00000482_g5078